MTEQNHKKRKAETEVKVEVEPETEEFEAAGEFETEASLNLLRSGYGIALNIPIKPTKPVLYENRFRHDVINGYTSVNEASLVLASRTRVSKACTALYALERFTVGQELQVRKLPGLTRKLYKLPYVPDSFLAVGYIYTYMSYIMGDLNTRICELWSDEDKNNTNPQVYHSSESLSDTKDEDLDEEGRRARRNMCIEYRTALQEWYCSTLDSPVQPGANRLKWKRMFSHEARFEEEPVEWEYRGYPFSLHEAFEGCTELKGIDNLELRVEKIALWIKHCPWRLNSYTKLERGLVNARSDLGKRIKEVASVCTWFPSCSVNRDIFGCESHDALKTLADKGVTLDRILEEYMIDSGKSFEIGRGDRIDAQLAYRLGMFMKAQRELKTETGINLLLLKAILFCQRRISIIGPVLEMISDFIIKIG